MSSISVNPLNKAAYFKRFTGKDLGDGFAIISMGRLQKKKGFDILVDAFPSVLEKFPNAKLLIAGQDDGELSNLTVQISSKGLSESIFLVGQLDGQDTYDFLGNGDLFVLPSHNENFGNVYAESLACGTPIIASKMTPWQEVEPNGCGLWVENTVQEVSKSIIQ
ncbi:MAG: glycosyltransferase, partial [Cytophagales bacterium]|nr:glycosyltransferase [Cytophagales bacterium]